MSAEAGTASWRTGGTTPWGGETLSVLTEGGQRGGGELETATAGSDRMHGERLGTAGLASGRRGGGAMRGEDDGGRVGGELGWEKKKSVFCFFSFLFFSGRRGESSS